jgi:hypothetical protein
MEWKKKERDKGTMKTRKPRKRGDCTHERPCPFMTCFYHVSCEVSRTGKLTVLHSEEDLPGLPYTCTLDAAEKGGLTLEQVAEIWGITRERIRQIEAKAIEKLKQRIKFTEFEDFIDPGPNNWDVMQDEYGEKR